MNHREIVPNNLIKQVEDYLPADPVMLVGSDIITFNVFLSRCNQIGVLLTQLE